MNADLRRLVAGASLLAAVAACLTGCAASAPARFYTLDVAAVAPAAAPLAGQSFVVGPVELPPYLDRPQMAIRKAGSEIEFREFQRWAEPLEATFTRVLTGDLILATGSQRVLAAPIPQRVQADYSLAARVSRFDVDDAGEAVLIVQWFVADREHKVLLAPRLGEYRRTLPAPPEPGPGAAALSGTIADFAADVARALAAAAPPTP